MRREKAGSAWVSGLNGCMQQDETWNFSILINYLSIYDSRGV